MHVLLLINLNVKIELVNVTKIERTGLETVGECKEDPHLQI